LLLGRARSPRSSIALRTACFTSSNVRSRRLGGCADCATLLSEAAFIPGSESGARIAKKYIVTISRSVLLAAVALAALVHADPALACGALPCAQINDVLPGNGSTGVPLNAELRVLYFGSWAQDLQATACGADPLSIRLISSGQANIELTATAVQHRSSAEAWAVAKPAAPLLANTEYHLQVRRGDAYGGDFEGADWTTVSSFTTGSAADNEAPLFSGADSFRYGDLIDTSSDCGAFKAIPAVPHAIPATDTSPGLRYDIYVNDVLERRYVENLGTLNESSAVYVNCGTTALGTDTLVTPGARVAVRAVDIAGNESAPNAAVEISVSCAPRGEVDAGATSEMAPADPQSASKAACALSFGVGGRATGRSWLFALLVACWARRIGGSARLRRGSA
jgi:hypothetical protein